MEFLGKVNSLLVVGFDHRRVSGPVDGVEICLRPLLFPAYVRLQWWAHFSQPELKW